MLLLRVVAQWEQNTSADLPARRWVKVLHRASCWSSLLLEGMAEFCPSWTVLDTVRHHARASSPFCSPADYRRLTRPIVRSNRTEYIYSHQPLYLLFISVGLMVWGFLVADHVHCYVASVLRWMVPSLIFKKKKEEANLSMVFSFYPQLQKRKRWFAPERKVGIKESPIRQRDNNPVTVFTIKFCVFVFINIAFIYWFKTEKNFQSILKKKLLKNKMTCGWTGMCTNPTKIDKWSTMSDPLKWFKWMTECHSFG